MPVAVVLTKRVLSNEHLKEYIGEALPDHLSTYLSFESRDELAEKARTLRSDYEHLRSSVNQIVRSWLLQDMLPPLNPFALRGVLEDLNPSLFDRETDMDNCSSSNLSQARRDLDTIESRLHRMGEILVERQESIIGGHVIYRFPERFEELHKVYYAIDILSYDYKARITNKIYEHIPVTLFGDRFALESYDFTMIPRSESYRSRYWPLMAHEMGHYKFSIFLAVKEMIDAEDQLSASDRNILNQDLRFFVAGTRNKIQKLNVHIKNVLGALDKSLAEEQLRRKYIDPVDCFQELLADALALAIAGPSYIFSFYNESLTLDDFPPGGEHPPDSIRLNLLTHVMSKILRIRDDERLDFDFAHNEGKTQSRVLQGFAQALLESQDDFDAIVKGLLSPHTSPYGEKDWNAATECLDDPDACLSAEPFQIMNSSWAKRLIDFQRAKGRFASFSDFVNLHKHDRKLFLTIVDALNKKYATEFSEKYSET